MALEDCLYNPPPGAPEAVRLGCVCPQIENHHGRGFLQDGRTRWWTRQDCPVHGPRDAKGETDWTRLRSTEPGPDEDDLDADWSSAKVVDPSLSSPGEKPRKPEVPA